MKIITLPYGNAGWIEKNLFLEKVISSRPFPPYIYNDVLIIVPSSRMRRAYGRLFLDIVARKYGAAALVPPEIQTLHQFFQNLYATMDGPTLMDENSRLVLLEGIVKERLAGNRLFSQSPDLLAPSLSAALAKMIEQLSDAGVNPDTLSRTIKGSEFSDKPQVRLLVDVYERYEKALQDKGIIDPQGMRAFILAHFDPAALSRYSRVIIDGIQDAGRIESGILRKVADRGNCTCLVHAPSPGQITQAVDFHPLSITRDFLSSLGAMPAQAHEGIPSGEEELFLASTLFSDRPFDEIVKKAPALSSFSKDIKLLSAVNAREEVSFIAGAVKKSLENGAAPDAILVAFPALDKYGPLVEELFNDYGIPYNRALGRQLSASPVATAVISLLRACQEDFSGPSLLRIFSSAFLTFGEHPSLAPALDRLMRDRRITGGREKLLTALSITMPRGKKETEKSSSASFTKGGLGESAGTSSAQTGELLAQFLADLFSALDPFSTTDTAPLSLWMERLSNLIAWSGLGRRVALIKGPLNVNLQASKKLNETLASLSRAGKLFPDYAYTFNEWLFLLKKTFMHARFQVPPEDESGVQILGLEESMGHAWEEIFLGGLIDNKFPQRLPQNIFLPEQTLQSMDVRTLEKARLNAANHFYRLLLSAEKVTLTYPENEGDRPVVPSPFLEELTPLKKAGLLNRGIERTSGIQFSLKIEESRSIPELAKAISLAGDLTGLSDILDSDIAGLAGIRSAINYQQPAQTSVPQQKREFWVTELDAYLNCPYDYYIANVLGIEPLEEVTEDISARDRGSKVHAILRNFYLSWNKAVVKESRDEARLLLKKLADSAFDREADTFRNRREKEFFLAIMAERFLDAEEEFWKQGMHPAYLEQKIEQFRLDLSNGEEVSLSAKIDRIDADPDGNFIIVDYKTGNYPLPKMKLDQDIFQLPVYAVMAQHALSGKEGAQGKAPLRKPIGLAYYDLGGKTGAGARDVVLFNKEARNDHPSSKPKAGSKSAEEFETILKQSIDRARKAVEGILAGDFTSAPRDENQCRYCPNEMMCGKRKS